MKNGESSVISLEQRIEDIVARQLSLQREFEEAKQQLEAAFEQEQESSLRSLKPGDAVYIFHVLDIPKRAQAKIGQQAREAIVVAHGDKACKVSVQDVEFSIRYGALLLPGGVIPVARAYSICKEIETKLRSRGRKKSR
ncbi:hypothetical protein VN12_24605 [Pirellula sp. SH-Sr6A]|uniref:hypothetical protein n=1 Tax=Pirellula sp. SH-Sr6A TaxID=1632865 RepID=UPI00078C37E2|nr:hypothetical protein [Pirellula sp. SH-Sr6A]AMV35330.1 hypothetical protein VN12_24605 [Pirellula sp. SH-Sr6A]